MFKTTKQTTLRLKLTIPPFKGNSCLKVLKDIPSSPPCWQKKRVLFFFVFSVLISKDSGWFQVSAPTKKTKNLVKSRFKSLWAPYMATSKLPTSCKACWIGQVSTWSVVGALTKGTPWDQGLSPENNCRF